MLDKNIQILDLFKSSIFYLLSQLSIFGLPVVLIPLLTRALSPEEFGITSLFFTLLSGLSGFVLLSGTGSVTRKFFFKDDDSFNFQCYIFNAVFVNVALCVFTLPLFYLLWRFNVFTLPSWLYLILPPMLLLTVVKTYKYKLWNVQKNSKSFAFFDFGFSFLGFSGVLLWVWCISNGAEARIIPMFFVEMMFCFLGVYFLVKEDGFEIAINIDYIKDIFKYGLPLLPHSIGLLLLGSFDKLIIGSFLDLASVGLYSIAVSYASLLSIFTISFDNLLRPILYEIFKRDRRDEDARYVFIFCVFLVSISVLAIIQYKAMTWVFPFFVGEDFQRAQEFVFWLIGSQICFALYRFWVKSIFFFGVTIWVSIATLIAGLLTLVCNILLVPKFGIEGAAVSSFFGSLASAILVFFFSLRTYKIRFKFFIEK